MATRRPKLSPCGELPHRRKDPPQTAHSSTRILERKTIVARLELANDERLSFGGNRMQQRWGHCLHSPLNLDDARCLVGPGSRASSAQ